MNISELRADGLTVPHTGLNDFHLSIRTGEMVGLRGPSGIGKTSLARILSGAHAPSAGRVLIDGQPPATGRHRRDTRVAMIAQNPREACNPRWTLERIITEPQRIAGGAVDPTGPAEQAQLPLRLLELRPAEVSDGQLQRAVVARALAQQARFLLCDEPTSALDPQLKVQMCCLLRSLADGGRGVLLISHEGELLERFCDRVVAL